MTLHIVLMKMKKTKMPELTCCLMPSYNHWRRSTQMSTSRRFPFRLKLNRLSIINLTSQGFQLRWVKYSSESEKGGVHVYVEHRILKGLHCELLFRKWTKVECLLCSYGTFSYLKKQTCCQFSIYSSTLHEHLSTFPVNTSHIRLYVSIMRWLVRGKQKWLLYVQYF